MIGQKKLQILNEKGKEKTATIQGLCYNFQYQIKTNKQNKNTTKEHIWM